MQNWDTMQPTANYDQHNSWYNNMFAANIKAEPSPNSPTTHLQQSPLQSPITTPPSTASQLEQYLKQQHHQHHNHNQMDSITAAAVAAAAMTPSPSQNDSLQHFFESTNMQQQILQQQQYQQQFQQAQQAAAQNQVTSTHLSLGFNPLTPPGLPNAVLPSMPHHFYQNSSSSMRSSNPQTPSPQPSFNPPHTLITPNDSVSEKLQAALTPRNTPPMDDTPPKSPASKVLKSSDSSSLSNCMEKDQDQMSNSSEDMKYESDDDESIRRPIYNSHGKMKNYKCKSCGLVAITKVSFWEHARSHMKPEKILQCPKCPFVTELKHHLEYHIRKHKNLKPFQCDKCSYSCVNKSMLNSHRKSHSSVYQYRCADCDYATKYCHSFKLHLRKYDHKPGMVLDEEGTPNPSIVIDVYGTRRGPKSKSGGGGSSNGNGSSGGNKRSCKEENNSNDMTYPLMTTTTTSAASIKANSQLSAALQGFPLGHQHHHHQQQPHHLPSSQTSLPVSPAKSSCSNASDLNQMTINMTIQQQQQLQQQQQHLLQQQRELQQREREQQNANGALNSNQASNQSSGNSASSLPNLLPPLSAILQQNPNPFLPYYLNLRMLAAHQQAAVLAQLSPRMREAASPGASQKKQKQNDRDEINEESETEDLMNEDEDEEMNDQKSVDSAMDLSQGTPTKEDEEDDQHVYNHHQHQNHQQPQQNQLQQSYNDFVAMNLKLKEDSTSETPLISNSSSSRRKGRVLKLETLLQTKSASQSPELVPKHASPVPQSKMASLPSTPDSNKTLPLTKHNESRPPAASSPISGANNHLSNGKHEDALSSLADESMEQANPLPTNKAANSANTSASSTASSSGNSSNSSNASSASTSSSSTTNSTSGNSSAANSPPIAAGAIYECKYCDIYFKDAVLYTIHMGYHSCDDVFKCNMCGEKCDGPVGLFVHMARNAHS